MQVDGNMERVPSETEDFLMKKNNSSIACSFGVKLDVFIYSLNIIIILILQFMLLPIRQGG